MNKKVVSIALLIAWMVAVFCFSAQNATQSSEVSGGVTDNILIFFSAFGEYKEIAETLIRKLAHFSIYAIGGALAMWHFGMYKFKCAKAILLAQVFGTLYAITDEIHQYFVPGRACQLRDVLIDSLGVAVGILVVLIIKEIIRRANQCKKS